MLRTDHVRYVVFRTRCPREHFIKIVVLRRGDDQSCRRNGFGKMVELLLDILKITENVGVIKFEVTHDHGARTGSE